MQAVKEPNNNNKLVLDFLYSKRRSSSSQRTYQNAFKLFEAWHGHKVSELLSLDREVIDDVLINYVKYMCDEKKASFCTVNTNIPALFSFIEFSDSEKILNVKKLRHSILTILKQ